MRTDAWYNFHYWYWNIRSWLCHFKILTCGHCRRNRRDEQNDRGE